MPRLQIRLTVMLMLVGLVLTCPVGFQAFGSDVEMDRQTLHGLQGVFVVVENITPAAERDGLTARQVHTDVELRLRQAGIRVLSREERWTIPGRPWLYIQVTTSQRGDGGLYAYGITVELNQDVWLARDPDIAALVAATWSVSGVGSIGAARIKEVRENVLDYVDRFINAYLAANPGQAGAGRRSRGPGNLIPEASTVRAVQWQLQEAGFDPGALDGKLGPHTRLALRQYQTRQGLTVTGELDDGTRRALGLKQ